MINRDAAGIDIGSGEHWVAVPEDRDEEPVRCFGCFTADLQAMARWLKKCGVTTVAMESTGVYWIPCYQILEEHGFQVNLVNARHVKNVPGRKGNVSDCQFSNVFTPMGSCPVLFVPTTRYASCVPTGDTGRTLSATPPTISSTCRRPSLR